MAIKWGTSDLKLKFFMYSCSYIWQNKAKIPVYKKEDFKNGYSFTKE